jgi:anti-sigma B factor antagonist
MEINIETVDEVTIVTMEGDVDSNSAPMAQEQILELATPGSRILLDLSGVKYMSSAGLRVLLSVHRQATRQEGTIVLVGLAEEIKDTMEITGFLNFFTVRDTVPDGVAALV